jgi:acetylornithine/succinyldiaminopimelate/putrescine aminotransferase/predicted amino acid dehydrogenase
MTAADLVTRAEAGDAYARHARPALWEKLHAIGLDVVYERGQGDYLYYRETDGAEVEVLDMLGGFGASLFGHSHPELVARAHDVLAAGRPFAAQASVRSLAAELAERLSTAIGRSTGRSYVATFASSGAEAVEAAIKHAELERDLRLRAIASGLRRTISQVRLGLREQTVGVPPDFLARAGRLLGLPRPDSLDDLFERIVAASREALDRAPVCLAVERAFHGKTTGALQLTFNPGYREPWRRIGPRVTFLPAEDEPAIERAVEAARVPFLDLQIDERGQLALLERSLVNVAACFVEPIQGEGGIRELSNGYLAALRRAADAGQFPLVLDEIQSGMGRTGTFLASEPSGVRGDYYLLAKALGGGLAKISALLVDRERYVPDFGLLHTSTFAEDDFSSAIGLGALDLLERDGASLQHRCREQGEHLLARLRALQARYPDVLADVRGRGLMVGVELASQAGSPSPLVRALSEQSQLGFFASGYLLREHRIRVAPTLSLLQTVRVEPSAFVSTAALDRFCDALECLLRLLRGGDSFRLARFLTGSRAEPSPSTPAGARPQPPLPAPSGSSAPSTARRVAFLGHFLQPGDMRDWDPGLAALSADECQRFLDRTRGQLEPLVSDRLEVHSAAGESVDLTVIALPFSSAQAMDALRAGEPGWLLELIDAGVALARRLGCGVVGFGGYTSILTSSCRTIVEPDLAITSGNSLTAATAMDALRQAAARLGVQRPRLGVLGAAGNIGAVLAILAADWLDDILLIGRPSAVGRLERAAGDAYAEAWQQVVRHGASAGLAGAIAGTRAARALSAQGQASASQVGEALRAGLAAELGEAAPVRVATDMDALKTCDLILTATNSPRPVVGVEHLGPGPLVICDVAAPRDTDPAIVGQRPDVTLLRGGILRAPLGQTLRIAGMSLEPGQVFGCLAETIVLGQSGVRDGLSYGKLTAGQVRRMLRLALQHGWSVEERPLRP